MAIMYIGRKAILFCYIPNNTGTNVISLEDYDSALEKLPDIDKIDLVVSDLWFRHKDKTKEFFARLREASEAPFYLGTGAYEGGEVMQMHEDPANPGRLASGVYVIEKPRLHVDLTYYEIRALMLSYPLGMFVIDSSELNGLTEEGQCKVKQAFEDANQRFPEFMERYGIKSDGLPRITRLDNGSIVARVENNLDLTMASVFRAKIFERFGYIKDHYKR
ncbi:MAG: hypothetical protein ABII01_01645 [Candidatus Woesearchaeota archaeon]